VNAYQHKCCTHAKPAALKTPSSLSHASHVCIPASPQGKVPSLQQQVSALQEEVGLKQQESEAFANGGSGGQAWVCARVLTAGSGVGVLVRARETAGRQLQGLTSVGVFWLASTQHQLFAGTMLCL
jgi:hypothetical protein